MSVKFVSSARLLRRMPVWSFAFVVALGVLGGKGARIGGGAATTDPATVLGKGGARMLSAQMQAAQMEVF